ncbi:TatD family hydrolase [Psychromonas algicola]|uniref:TatD family hydrolase n=1 Tax=Psychromonas algicola TaxID=2555642 RepID=UPI0010687454|nr:TatD family hydrolase [Psychromonas sp. RZ5]TEW47672.1 TatD family deoxyribonuclease [Psychromonas sp. RZ5]
MFVDSHCHLNFDCFKAERASLMQQLAEVKINQVIVPGTDKSRWPEIIKLAADYKNIYFALGIHPHFLNTFEDADLLLLTSLLVETLASENNKCVALGEIGLDKLIDTAPALQEKVFLAQLAIAESLKLPVILHVVKTQSRVLALLKQAKFSYGGVYHAFSGSEEIAKEFIKLGFKLGIGGVITHPSAQKTKATLSQLPLSSLVLETDAPDMPIYQQSSSHNSPLNLISIYQSLCNLRRETPLAVQRQLYLNTQSIFPIIND